MEKSASGVKPPFQHFEERFVCLNRFGMFSYLLRHIFVCFFSIIAVIVGMFSAVTAQPVERVFLNMVSKRRLEYAMLVSLN